MITRQQRFEFSAKTAAFTMLEIAISLAIIAFAVVAIIGILPAGMTVQRENREDTIVNQDGPYFLEAIRNGASDLDELVEHIERINLVYEDTNSLPAARQFRTNSVFVRDNNSKSANVLSVLSLPRGASDPADPASSWKVFRAEAQVKSISGAAAEKRAPGNEMAFQYLMATEVIPFEQTMDSYTNSIRGQNLRSNLFDLRLTLRWPLILGNNDTFVIPQGGGRKTFRTMISGIPDITNGFNFFNQGKFVQAKKE